MIREKVGDRERKQRPIGYEPEWSPVPDENETGDGGKEVEEQSPEERIIEAIDAAVAKLSTKIDVEGLKPADLIKLLQLRKELVAGRPKYVSIRWVGECDEQTSWKD